MNELKEIKNITDKFVKKSRQVYQITKRAKIKEMPILWWQTSFITR